MESSREGLLLTCKQKQEAITDMEKYIRKSIAKSLTGKKLTMEDLKKELNELGESEFILVIPLTDGGEGGDGHGK